MTAAPSFSGSLAYVICPDGFRVEVEVARGESARAMGLMFRDCLEEAEGMLFPFDVPGRYGFWMKNVRIPLDIIWLDARGRVVWLVERAAPCAADPCPTYRPEADASYVVEVAGGFAGRHRVSPGSTVAITQSNSDSTA